MFLCYNYAGGTGGRHRRGSGGRPCSCTSTGGYGGSTRWRIGGGGGLNSLNRP